MTERMEKAIEYRDILREIEERENRIFGTEPTNALPLHLVPAKKAPEPKEEKPEPKKKGGVRVKIDRGKLFALKNAGWTNAEIALDLGCTEKHVANTISAERNAAREEGREPRV